MIDPIPELKRQVAAELVRALEGWRATDLQFYARIDRWRLSDLRRGKLERFSLESLIRYLAQLRYRVELSVVKEPRVRKQARRSPRSNDATVP